MAELISTHLSPNDSHMLLSGDKCASRLEPDRKIAKKAIVEVEGGENVSPQWVRALGQVVERERAKVGVLVMLGEPTTTMKREAAAARF